MVSLIVPALSSLGQLPDRSLVEKLVSKSIDNKNVFGITLAVSQGDQTMYVAGGDLSDTSSYFIASTTKLYVSAVMFMSEVAGKIRLDDPISRYLDPSVIKGLHVYKGVDYGSAITIRQLLSHTSGLPDYLQDKGPNGKSLFTELKKGNDLTFTFEDILILSKKIKPHFAPGTPGKAFYSDLNYQLLGKIASYIYGKPLNDVFQDLIYSKLNLTQTYIYASPTDRKPATMYFNAGKLDIPKAMTSFTADGGIVSTTRESLIFIRAFMDGTLFPKSYVTVSQSWLNIFPPLKYGNGMMKFGLPKYFTAFQALPALYGHSGHSGAFDWYCPGTDTYYVGTVNQINKPSISFKVLVNLQLLVKAAR
jgi:CubicO group peptidase (beta-lactamase class C family)